MLYHILEPLVKHPLLELRSRTRFAAHLVAGPEDVNNPLVEVSTT